MIKSKKYDAQRLLYRRQFILGPSFMMAFPSWKTLQVRDTIRITAHPDLNVLQTSREGKSVTLLGYLLDPDQPEASDSDILERLLNKLLTGLSFEEVVLETESFGGRWILIVDDGEDVRLFNDPMGLRQVHYTGASTTRSVWCATQPGLLLEVLKLELDPHAVESYMSSNVYRKWRTALWPGDTSPYKEVFHLLPNHYLDLKTGSCQRYWPDQALPKIPLEEAAESGARLLAGIIRSAAKRFELGMAFSAGWDSRVLLAASKDLCRNIYFYTYYHNSRAADSIIPPMLLSRLGLKCHFIKYPSRMEGGYESIYNRSVVTAHSRWGRMSQAVYAVYPSARVCITGNAAEITRVRFRLPSERPLSGRTLARFFSFEYPDEMERIDFVVKAWDHWLSRLGNIYNVHPLDLFYWEHWGGNFAAMDQNEMDIVHESLTPYNCRRYLVKMLSVDEKYRDHDEPIHYRMMIHNLWPEVLREPVNPPRKGNYVLLKAIRLKRMATRFLITSLRQFGLYSAVREAYHLVKGRNSREVV